MCEMMQDFFVQNAYVLELVISITLFCHFFERKDHFVLRFLTVLVCLFAMTVLLNSWRRFYEGYAWAFAAYSMGRYILSLLLGYLGILFCMKTQPFAALFSMICAVAAQHMAYRIYSSILAYIGLDFASGLSSVIIVVVSAVVYVSLYFVLVKRIKEEPERCFESRSNIVLGGLLILFSLVLQFSIEVYLPMNEMRLLYIFVSGYDILCCTFTLFIEYGLFQNKILSNEKALLKHLMRRQMEQYRSSKANEEMINIKCHDIKHQISRMTGRADSKFLSELENIISIYDLKLKTGNEVLDVFLMEKEFLCKKHGIKLDCIVDGACLNFMEPSDVYSLFGNAIDNAIEALCRIEDREKRIIGLSVKRQLGMVIIHIENYFEGSIAFVDSVPKTTKASETYHGFGVKSIRMAVEKYGGHLTISTQNGIFNLNVSIPGQEPEQGTG